MTGKTLGAEVVYERGSYNVSSDECVDVKLEGYTLGESLSEYGGADIYSSNGRSGEEVSSKLEGSATGESFGA